MSVLAAGIFSFVENKSFSQGSDLPTAPLQVNLRCIIASTGLNVAGGGLLDIGGYPKSTPTLSAYQMPEEKLSPDLTARLNELSLVKNGWDHGDGLKINPEAIKVARNVLRNLSWETSFQPPSIVPTFDGFLQFEWHSALRALEFEYTPGGWSILGVNSVNLEHPSYNTALVPLANSADLNPYYSWFSSDELIWPSR